MILIDFSMHSLFEQQPAFTQSALGPS